MLDWQIPQCIPASQIINFMGCFGEKKKYELCALRLLNPGSANATSDLFYGILTLVFNFIGWYKLGSCVLKKVFHRIDGAEF